MVRRTLAALALTTMLVPAALSDSVYFRVTEMEEGSRDTTAGFGSRVGVLLGGIVESDVSAHVSSSERTVSATNGEVRVCTLADCSDRGDAGWTTSTTVTGGQFLQARRAGPTSPSERQVVEVTVGTSTYPFEIVARPEAPSFSSIASWTGDPHSSVASAASTFSGWVSTRIDVEGGEYSVCSQSAGCSAPSSSTGTVRHGDEVHLHGIAGAWSQTRQVRVEAGGASATFEITARDKDEAPDAFGIAGVTGADPSSTTTSEAVTPVGYDGPVTVSADGGVVSVAGRAFSQTASIDPGESFQVRASAHASWNGRREIAVAVGETGATWRIDTRAQDVAPDAFEVATVSEVDRSVTVTSAEILPRAFDGPITVRAEGGLVSVGRGEFVESASLDPGESFRVRTTSHPDWDGVRNVRVVAGTTSATWRVETRAQIVRPDDFGIAGSDGLDPNALTTSSATTVEGFDGPITVRAEGATVSVEGRDFETSAPIDPGQSFRVRANSSGEWNGVRDVPVSVGSSTATWRLETRAQDVAPDAFEIASSRANPGATTESAPVVLEGFDGPVELAAQGGSVSVGGEPFAASATIDPGQSFRVRAVADAAWDGARDVRVTAGSTSATWRIDTRAQDVAPDTFTLARTDGADPGESVDSTIATLEGFDGPVNVSANGGTVSVAGRAFAASASIHPGQTLQVRANASAAWNSSRVVRVTAGTTVTDWTIGTRAQDTTPTGMSFATTSGQNPNVPVTSPTATLAGFDGPVTVTAPGATVSVANGAFASSAQIHPGQTLRIQATSPNAWSSGRTIAVTAGSVSANWTIQTRAQATSPSGMSFATTSGQNPNTSVISPTATLSGFDGPVTVSASGATVSVGGGAFVSSAQINPGQTLRVQATSAGGWSAGRTITVTAGSASANWTIQNRAQDVTPNGFGVATTSNAEPGGWVVSAATAVYGFDGPVTIHAPGANVLVNGVTGWVSSAQIHPGQSFQLQATAAGGFSTGRNIAVYVGSGAANWHIASRAARACQAPWGQWMSHGQGVTAYAAPSVPHGHGCAAEARYCSDGTLTGSYGHQSCHVQAPPVTYSWQTSAWDASECAYSCGWNGNMTRQVWCQSSTGQTVWDGYCNSAHRPVASSGCGWQGSCHN